jgi:hypothetical protein
MLQKFGVLGSRWQRDVSSATYQLKIIYIGKKAYIMERNLYEYKGKVFRHFKGDLYLLMDIAKHSETGDELVIYKALYGDCGIFARPYTMFNEKVPMDKVNPMGQGYRFEYIEVKSVKEE